MTNLTIREFVNPSLSDEQVSTIILDFARPTYLDQPKLPNSLGEAVTLMLTPTDYKAFSLDKCQKEELDINDLSEIDIYFQTLTENSEKILPVIKTLERRIKARLMYFASAGSKENTKDNLPSASITRLGQILQNVKRTAINETNKPAFDAVEAAVKDLKELAATIFGRTEVLSGPVHGAVNFLFFTIANFQCQAQNLRPVPENIKKRLLLLVEIIFKQYTERRANTKENKQNKVKEGEAIKEFFDLLSKNLWEMQRKHSESRGPSRQGVLLAKLTEENQTLQNWIDFEVELLHIFLNTDDKSSTPEQAFSNLVYRDFVRSRAKQFNISSTTMVHYDEHSEVFRTATKNLENFLTKAPISKRLIFLECLINEKYEVSKLLKKRILQVFKLLAAESLATFEFLSFQEKQLKKYRQIDPPKQNQIARFGFNLLHQFAGDVFKKADWQGDYYEAFQDFLQKQLKIRGREFPQIAKFVVWNFSFANGKIPTLQFDSFHGEMHSNVIEALTVFKENIADFYPMKLINQKLQNWAEDIWLPDFSFELRASRIESLVTSKKSMFSLKESLKKILKQEETNAILEQKGIDERIKLIAFLLSQGLDFPFNDEFGGDENPFTQWNLNKRE